METFYIIDTSSKACKVDLFSCELNAQVIECPFTGLSFLFVIPVNVCTRDSVGDSLAILKTELKSQKKHVRSLKKKSLWSKILEEVRRVPIMYLCSYSCYLEPRACHYQRLCF